MVEKNGGFGWTGNDLFTDYTITGKQNSLGVVRTISWPEEIKPRLCLLGPAEDNIEFYARDGFMLVAPTKYRNLVNAYLQGQPWTPLLYFIDGQVEKEVRRGNADLAIDIVYSGRTIQQEKLSIYDIIFDRASFVLLTKDI